MKISVFGLGYVGTVSAACLSARGHHVIGSDINGTKVELLKSGSSPIVEANISELVRSGVACGKLTATNDSVEAVVSSDLSIVCVGTPSSANGSIDTRAIRVVCEEIGAAIGKKKANQQHTIVVRSTILPGTFRSLVVPTLEGASGNKEGTNFRAALNPEFMREGTAVCDFNNPPKTVIGSDDPTTGDIVASLYDGLPGPVVRTTPEVAELIKYVDNPWHALKVAFANEIGNICQAVGVDSYDVMNIFMLDQKLNISKAYLRPGFAFGGSCLPKDLRAITNLAQRLDVATPVLRAISDSNHQQIERAIGRILALGKRKVAVLGCSFKEGTDDLRESPYVILIERLIGKGCDVAIYDNNIRLAMLTGANRDYINATIPHISRLMVELPQKALAEADLVMITANTPEYLSAIAALRDHQHLLDFARIDLVKRPPPSCYHAVNW